jgi:hypothetical protein
MAGCRGIEFDRPGRQARPFLTKDPDAEIGQRFILRIRFLPMPNRRCGSLTAISVLFEASAVSGDTGSPIVISL